uniref:Secreted protein n=1 Tax=Schlesneria paludicola TaxID=360056 RepID=A0A7C2NYS7_9PLAN
MVKSLLILMLVATQLLSGSSGSVYLCVKSDGTCCCLDSGPVSCNCCHDHGELPQALADSGCDNVACHCHDRDGVRQAEQSAALVDDGCGCTHIPLIVAVEQPARIVRTALATDVERLAQLVAWLPALHVGDDVPVLWPPTTGSQPTGVPDFALTVISTVVIRC